MLNIVLYFHVHQPYRLKRLNLFDIGNMDSPFDDDLNRDIIKRVSQKCYIPANSLLLRLIDRFGDRFKTAFSITGTAMEQFQRYAPEVVDSFAELAGTGNVELVGETFYHSLSYLYDSAEFAEQIRMHLDLLKKEFSITPVTFRNTELIYEDRIADVIKPFRNFKTILTEGADRILGKRSPLNPYRTCNDRYFLMLKHYFLSDDIAFRFSDKRWYRYPLTPYKFLSCVNRLMFNRRGAGAQFLNLFMDYETFGEHQWKETGIFDFLAGLAEMVMTQKDIVFACPRDVLNENLHAAPKLSVTAPISWADRERDLSAWLSNDIQKNAVETLYQLLKIVKQKGDEYLLNTLRKLTSSDHLYYMCTKYLQDGDIHRYFSPYSSPEEAYNLFLFALADIEEKLE